MTEECYTKTYSQSISQGSLAYSSFCHYVSCSAITEVNLLVQEKPEEYAYRICLQYCLEFVCTYDSKIKIRLLSFTDISISIKH